MLKFWWNRAMYKMIFSRYNVSPITVSSNNFDYFMTVWWKIFVLFSERHRENGKNMSDNSPVPSSAAQLVPEA